MQGSLIVEVPTYQINCGFDWVLSLGRLGTHVVLVGGSPDLGLFMVPQIGRFGLKLSESWLPRVYHLGFFRGIRGI